MEGWEEERRVGRLVSISLLSGTESNKQISETNQTRFAVLSNPSLLPPLFPSLTNPTAPQISLSSLATSTTAHLPNLQSAQHLLQSYAPGAKRPQGQSVSPALPVVEEEPSGPDPRDVDRVLGELVALGGRWAMFKRFAWDRVGVSGRALV